MNKKIRRINKFLTNNEPIVLRKEDVRLVLLSPKRILDFKNVINAKLRCANHAVKRDGVPARWHCQKNRTNWNC